MPMSPPILAYEQSTVSVAITDMTDKRNDDVPGVESHLGELWVIPETPALGSMSRPCSRVQTVPSFYHDQEQTSR